MEARVKEAEHFKLAAAHNRLRAIQAEQANLQAQYARLQEEEQRARATWAEALQDAGKAAKLKGEPDTWQVRIGEQPGDTVIIAPDEGGGDA